MAAALRHAARRVRPVSLFPSRGRLTFPLDTGAQTTGLVGLHKVENPQAVLKDLYAQTLKVCARALLHSWPHTPGSLTPAGPPGA